MEELKNAQQESNQQIDILAAKVAQITLQVKSTEKKLMTSNRTLSNLKKNVEDLVVEKDALEQYTIKYNIGVHSVPERSGENLSELIPLIAKKLGSSITRESIDIVHRVFIKSPGAKPIIVKLKATGQRKTFFSWPDVIPAIYINENLTQRRRQLFGKVWKLKKARKFHRVWTTDRRRKTPGDRAIYVADDSVLDEL